MSRFKKSKTNRGFPIITFADDYGVPCSIQKSSSAMEERIWIGVTDKNCRVMASNHPDLAAKRTDCPPHERNNGWVDYPLPPDAVVTTRMHINRRQARKIAAILLHFSETWYVSTRPNAPGHGAGEKETHNGQ